MGRRYVLCQTTRQVQAFVTQVIYRVDVDTLHRERESALGLNQIGLVEVTTGLTSGERVATKNVTSLADGTKVS